MNNYTIAESKHTQDIRLGLNVTSQAHSDLAQLCEVVCTNKMQAFTAFNDLVRISRNIESICKALESHPENSPIFAGCEECDLAHRFLTCVIFKIWTEDNPPTQQPLEWCDAVVIYGVVFSAMHRLELGLKAFAQVTACSPRLI